MKHRSLFCFLILQFFYPLCVLLGQLMDRPFVLASQPLYCLWISAGTVALTIRLRRLPDSGLAVPALPLTLLHALTILLTLPWYGGIAAVILVLCGWMVFETALDGIWRKVSMVFSVLTSLGLLLISPIWLFVSAMGHEEVVSCYPSPAGNYTAIVTSADQGALGGDTLVEVRDEAKSVNLLIGSFRKAFEIYRGPWGQWETMTLSWREEDTLLIDGIPHSVSTGAVETIQKIATLLSVEITQAELLQYEDSHGGFQGDGSTLARIRCKLDISESPYWHPLPAGETIREALYGGPTHAAFFQSDGGEPVVPEIESGQYFFYDRHPTAQVPEDDSQLFRRGSYNFTLAVYDEDAKILYYFELDT